MNNKTQSTRYFGAWEISGSAPNCVPRYVLVIRDNTNDKNSDNSVAKKRFYFFLYQQKSKKNRTKQKESQTRRRMDVEKEWMR